MARDRRLHLLSLGFGLVLALARGASAEEAPRLLFASDGGQFPVVGAPVAVDARLVQVSLAANLVLAAGEGANFLIEEAPGGPAGTHILGVGRGPVLLIDTARQRMERLGRGSYLVGAGRGSEPAALQGLGNRSPGDDSPAHRDLELRQGFQLGDAIMTRQQAYLDSIRIDVRDINRAFSSLLRAIAGK